MIEIDGRRVVALTNQFAPSRRCLGFYATIVACHFFDGFGVDMIGFVLPGIGIT